jgi:hypothetical protein
MRRQRKSPRFLVGPNFPLVAHIPQSPTRVHKLRTIGPGGVGFFASNKDAKLLQTGDVDLHLTVGNSKLQVKGRIQYCQFFPKNGVNFLGIEFQNEDPKINLLLQTILEGALAKGHLVLS